MAKRWILSPLTKENVKEILSSVEDFTGYWASAVSLWNDLQDKFNLLVFMPTIGKVREDGTMETFCRKYRIIYRQINDEILILTVIHSSRIYPRSDLYKMN